MGGGGSLRDSVIGMSLPAVLHEQAGLHGHLYEQAVLHDHEQAGLYEQADMTAFTVIAEPVSIYLFYMN